MRVIPVIDILNGVVVHGIAGNRSRYRPIRSRVTESCDPSVVLRVFEQQFGFRDCYLADLDAIRQQSLNRCTLAELAQGPAQLMVDRGVRNESDVEELLDLGVTQVIVALETLPDPATAARLLQKFGPDRLLLSLDLQNGSVMAEHPEWNQWSPQEVATQLFEIGFHRMIVLDLSAVGRNEGTPTLSLCQSLQAAHPELTLITGGGVRDVTDLQQLEAAAIDGVLLASALHNGGLTPDQLSRWR